MCTSILPLPKSYKEPTTKEILEKLEKLERNTGSITLTGGEPTLRKDLLQILKYINKEFPETKINLITNARLFHYLEFVNKMKTINNLTISTELYGSNEKIHNSITLSDKSFQQTFNGIKNLIDNNFKVELRMVISKLNYTDLPALAELYMKHFKEAFQFVMFPIDLIGNAIKNKDQTLVKYSTLIPFVEKALNTLKDKNVKTYHIPYCVLNKKFWKYIEGKTASENRLTPALSCNECLFNSNCPKIWTSYYTISGTDEFKPIKQK
jgi:MoaA/NifB/PqqE/SkfB family radical SAM enzyme